MVRLSRSQAPTLSAIFSEVVVVVDGRPPGEVVGEHAPLLATALQEVEDGVSRISRRSWVLGRPYPSGVGR